MVYLGAQFEVDVYGLLGQSPDMQTNLVADLPRVAAVTDPNLVNSGGTSESATSLFGNSDNNAGISTLSTTPGQNSAPVAINPPVVNNPTLPSRGPAATPQQDIEPLKAALAQLAQDKTHFADNTQHAQSLNSDQGAATSGFHRTALDNVFAGLDNSGEW
jgi:hypothetical protein